MGLAPGPRGAIVRCLGSETICQNTVICNPILMLHKNVSIVGLVGVWRRSALAGLLAALCTALPARVMTAAAVVGSKDGLAFLSPAALVSPTIGMPAASALRVPLQHAHSTAGGDRKRAVDRAGRGRWPDGAASLEFERLEGIILVQATLRGPSGVDTSGILVLDTGAGYLGVDPAVALRLGLTATQRRSDVIELTDRPLSRLVIGTLQIDQLSPVVSVDLEAIRRATGRAVLGLLGQHVFSGRALWVDYQRQELIVIPAPTASTVPDSARPVERDSPSSGQPGPRSIEASRAIFGDLLSPYAAALPFRLEGDGKLLVRARFSNPKAPRFSSWLTFVFDTGATKCVLFDPGFGDSVPGAKSWRSVSGLAAPTLLGTASARVALVPEVQVAGEQDSARGVRTSMAAKTDVDCAVLESELAEVLSRGVGEPVYGLVGYSFLKRFRLGIDYGHRVLWLDAYPRDWDSRPYEYSHVGLQVERDGEALLVVAVATGSPAARAGIAPGDELLSVDGKSVRGVDLESVLRKLEGPPGSRVTLVTRRGAVIHTMTLARKQLL